VRMLIVVSRESSAMSISNFSDGASSRLSMV
jgi:hypothetical protein